VPFGARGIFLRQRSNFGSINAATDHNKILKIFGKKTGARYFG